MNFDGLKKDWERVAVRQIDAEHDVEVFTYRLEKAKEIAEKAKADKAKVESVMRALKVTLPIIDLPNRSLDDTALIESEYSYSPSLAM